MDTNLNLYVVLFALAIACTCFYLLMTAQGRIQAQAPQAVAQGGKFHGAAFRRKAKCVFHKFFTKRRFPQTLVVRNLKLIIIIIKRERVYSTMHHRLQIFQLFLIQGNQLLTQNKLQLMVFGVILFSIWFCITYPKSTLRRRSILCLISF